MARTDRLSLQVHGAYVADEAAGVRVFRAQHLDQRRRRGKDVQVYRGFCRRRQIFHRVGLSACGGLRASGGEGTGVSFDSIGGVDREDSEQERARFLSRMIEDVVALSTNGPYNQRELRRR